MDQAQPSERGFDTRAIVVDAVDGEHFEANRREGLSEPSGVAVQELTASELGSNAQDRGGHGSTDTTRPAPIPCYFEGSTIA